MSPKLAYREWIRGLYRQFTPIANDIDIIVLPEFNTNLAWLAAWLARRYRKRLIVDAFVSVYDSAVHDRETTRSQTPQAIRYWLMDWLALQVGERLLADTATHADYFTQQFGIRRDRFHVIPVGAASEWFDTPSASNGGKGLLVQFYGTYIPLHGVQTILDAACLLQAHANIHFEMIGHGQTYPDMRHYAHRYGLDNVTFLDPVSPDHLPAMVARADICLGIFGTTDKAARVIPNKVYQTLALGKPLITADTPALREAFQSGEHLLAVPPGDSQALAQAVSTLAADAPLRHRLAAAGRARMETAFTEHRLGGLLLEALM
jgi:glycosyltransferase involved in cell wall biosynthesis